MKCRWPQRHRPSLNRTLAHGSSSANIVRIRKKHTRNRNQFCCALHRRWLDVNRRSDTTLHCSGGRSGAGKATGTGLESRWRMVVAVLRDSSLVSFIETVRLQLFVGDHQRRRHITHARMRRIGL